MRFVRFFKLTFPACFLSVIFVAGATPAAMAADQDEIDFSLLENYATFANAAYLDKTEAAELSREKQYTLSHYSNIPGLAVTYFLLTNDTTKTHVIAVRGTSNIENTLVDMDVKLVTDPHTGIRLHRGFSQAAERIYREVKPMLNPDYAISTTGHSLGGAVALILAMYLDLDQFDIKRVVTFGQPKVTNIAGADRFSHLNVLRVVTPNDLVPLVPPMDPVDINDLDIYWHLGKEVILLPVNQYAVLEGVSSMLRAVNFTQQPLDEDNIRNHEMARYLSQTKIRIPGATRIPFEIDGNLFNLFGGGTESRPHE